LLVQLFHNILALLVVWFSLAGFLLTVFVVNDISGDPPADSPVSSGFPFGKTTPIVNAVIQVIYIFLLIFQFVLALGSRPKSHVLGYMVSFIGFAFIQLYLFMNLIYLTKRLIDFKMDPNGSSRYAYINKYCSDVGSLTVLITAISVLGVYIAAGIISFDPWHLLTCWAQYLLMSSTYVNILNIYAFCNAHDMSWGRKTGQKHVGTSNASPLPLHAPQATVYFNAGAAPHEDIDIPFEATVKRALNPPPRERLKDTKEPEEEFFKFRTVLVMTYIFSNALVCLVVLNDTF
jgi:chitin synthase